jgi:hypothetical protein
MNGTLAVCGVDGEVSLLWAVGLSSLFGASEDLAARIALIRCFGVIAGDAGYSGHFSSLYRNP